MSVNTRTWRSHRPSDQPGCTASTPGKAHSPQPYLTALTMFPRLPVLSLFTLKDQFIAFAGSVHVVIMNLKKKEQDVILIK